MTSALLAPDKITVLPFCSRPPAKVSDDLLRKSIERHGIQQPLIVVPDGERRLLAKGLSRLRVAKALGLAKLPVLLDPAPAGVEPERHAARLRFVLNHHRQDLLPSQKGELVWTLKARFGMSNGDVASYLGVAADSITNWLAVRQYIPAVVAAMDAGRLSMNAARVFDGMTETGQRAVWKAHGEEILHSPAALSHKLAREQYPPDTFPAFYRQPELVASRLRSARRGAPRKGKSRPALSEGQKRLLLANHDLRETELAHNAEELKRYEREINAAIAPVGAILRTPALLALVPEPMREELERFAEVYV